MNEPSTSKRGITPPKGRPTRARSEIPRNERVFGPVSQWIAFAVLLILAFVVMVILTNGGDFNPLDDGNSVGAVVGFVATIAGPV